MHDLIYNSLIFLYFNYSLLVWGRNKCQDITTKKKNQDCLFLTQNTFSNNEFVEILRYVNKPTSYA